jgi:hypothetical protein
MTIQWFPGHMAKTKRLIQEQLQLVDLVIELGDARLPESSQNPMLQKIINGRKPVLLVLNKNDLADPNRTKFWIDKLSKEYNQKAIALSATDSKAKIVKLLVESIYELTQEKRTRLENKGAKNVTMRAMIVGIPNVGKSTFINTLLGKNVVVTGNKPGVTRGKQWIRLSDDIELLDTPGILWPKFENSNVGMKLAISGAISDEVFVQEEGCYFLIKQCKDYYSKFFADRYSLDQDWVKKSDPYDVMLEIGKNRGCLLKGHRVDELKTAKLILKDFRLGKIGRISLE